MLKLDFELDEEFVGLRALSKPFEDGFDFLGVTLVLLSYVYPLALARKRLVNVRLFERVEDRVFVGLVAELHLDIQLILELRVVDLAWQHRVPTLVDISRRS